MCYEIKNDGKFEKEFTSQLKADKRNLSSVQN